jgi:hypothetical protein
MRESAGRTPLLIDRSSEGRDQEMYRNDKKLAVVLITAALALSTGLAASEKRGAEVVVQTRGGQESRGELIAVRAESLVIKEAKSEDGLSFKIDEIRSVRIVNRPQTLKWTLMGAVFGGVAFPATKYFLFVKEESYSAGEWFSKRSTEGLGLVAVIGVVVGAVAGTIVGGSKGVDQVFPFEDPMMRTVYLQRLGYLARVREAP